MHNLHKFEISDCDLWGVLKCALTNWVRKSNRDNVKMNGAKNILIVYAHQEPKSFNAALKDEAVSTMAAQGHNVTVSDLCQLKFDPVDYPHYFKGK